VGWDGDWNGRSCLAVQTRDSRTGGVIVLSDSCDGRWGAVALASSVVQAVWMRRPDLDNRKTPH
jgi:hypothetical protein